MSRNKKYSTKSHMKQYSVGLLLLCSASLLSVGFSTWYTGANSTQTGTVDIEIADTIETVNDFITFDKTADVFKFCQYGIVDEKNEMIVYTGDIIVGFSVDITKLKANAKTYFSKDLTDFDISATISHSYTDFNNLLNPNSYLKSVSLGMSTTSEISSFDTSSSSYKYSYTSYQSSFDITPDMTAEALYFKLKYSFEFPQGTFETDVYSKITHKDLVFNLNVEVVF